MVVFIRKNLYFLSPILGPILGPVQGPVHVFVLCLVYAYILRSQKPNLGAGLPTYHTRAVSRAPPTPQELGAFLRFSDQSRIVAFQRRVEEVRLILRSTNSVARELYALPKWRGIGVGMNYFLIIVNFIAKGSRRISTGSG